MKIRDGGRIALRRRDPLCEELKRRPPLAVIRHCLECLEGAALNRGEFPTLVHTALEALDRHEREAVVQ